MGYISDKYNVTPEAVVRMSHDGIVDWRVEYLYEFYNFYKELSEQDGKHSARKEIMLLYKISQGTFYRWINISKKTFS